MTLPPSLSGSSDEISAEKAKDRTVIHSNYMFKII